LKNSNCQQRYIPSTPFPDSSKRRSKQHLTQNIVIGNENKDIREFYDIDNLPVLGSGISGSVKICIHKTTKIKYALKTLSKRKLQPNKISKLKKEMQIMADLDHPNILRLQEYFETRENIFLVLELCRFFSSY
jgi:calcium-dependent protein kinase